jgi:hypothetical protein
MVCRNRRKSLESGKDPSGEAEVLQPGSGVGPLLYGFVTRLRHWSSTCCSLWAFLVEIIGASITSNHWLLDTAVRTPWPGSGHRPRLNGDRLADRAQCLNRDRRPGRVRRRDVAAA